jgi:hypothetical protein
MRQFYWSFLLLLPCLLCQEINELSGLGEHLA